MLCRFNVEVTCSWFFVRSFESFTTSMKSFVLLIFVSCVTLSFSQNLASLNSGNVVELDAVELNSGVLISATMERSSLGDRVVLYRSIDYGVNWVKTDSIEEGSIGLKDAFDPVLAVDSAGNIYLCVMREVGVVTGFLQVDLTLYVSGDEGLSWSYVGSPHTMDGIADYPQIVAGGEHNIFLVYTHFSSPTGSGGLTGTVVFKSSVDGGVTWSAPKMFSARNGTVGPDIQLNADHLTLAFGDVDSNEVYVSSSSDFGISWSVLDTLPNSDNSNICKIAKSFSDTFGLMVSHKPHQINSPIHLHRRAATSLWETSVLAQGAYGEIFVEQDSIIHFVYNQKMGNQFNVVYQFSTNKGVHLSPPLVLYTSSYSNDEKGEYQSLFKGNDGLMHLTFCDWADQSKAKTLIFAPFIIQSNAELMDINESFYRIYPNPAETHFSISSEQLELLTRVELTDFAGNHIKIWDSLNGAGLYDIQSVAAGNYILRLHEENRVIVHHLVKK